MRLDSWLAHRHNIFGMKRNLIVIPNVSYGFFLWGEADLIAVTKSGYVVEGEIKASLSDLKADLIKHKWNGHYGRWKRDIKRHFYIIPKDILEKATPIIREESGIITYCPHGEFGEYKCDTIRFPKSNSEAEKLEHEKLIKLCRLSSFRFWSGTEILTEKI